MKSLRFSLLAVTVAGSLTTAWAGSDQFLGRWALTIPGGGAGWLSVTKENGYYDGTVMWGAGSVVPVSDICFDGDTMYVTRIRDVQRKDSSGKVVRTQQIAEAILAQIDGDELKLVEMNPQDNGEVLTRNEFTGKRIPNLPPAPDLNKVKFGDPIQLFNGKDLSGWRLTDPNQKSGWSAKEGLLVNDAKQEPGKHVSYGNLRTDREFEDFNLTLEANVSSNGNSGIYLRGIYEIQVADTYGHPLDPHNMGALYSRITPSISAEKPPGEWQTYDITMVDRHLTVILNGKKIIDNQPMLGCTGGALWSDETRPGPIYLQGDHTSVMYRNIVLRPVVK